jgi:class 3 adenylate cyclase
VAFQELDFVGRQREMEEVLAALAGPGITIVSGVAGMGKSRLLAEVRARRLGPAVSARAFLPERDEAWALARSLLRDACSLDPEALAAVPARAVAALVEIVPELADAPPGDAGPLDPESRRALALEAAVRLLSTVQARGALVVVDDIQWADPTSLRLVNLLIRRAPELKLVLAFRPEDVVPDSALDVFLRELPGSGPACCSVVLEPLGGEALRELFGDDPVGGAVAEETDGTPLAVTEVLRAMTAQGVVGPDPSGRWRPLAPGADAVARQVARSGQRRVIQGRAARESRRRRKLLSLLALLGREMPARLLATAAEEEESDVLGDLEALGRSGLVRLGEAGWATAHDVIGEAVVEDLARPERGRLHHRLARALEEERKDPAEIARHLAGSGDSRAAAAAFARAARESLGRFAGDEAVLRSGAGLDLDPADAVMGELLETRAEGRAIIGDLADAREDLRAVLRLEPSGRRRSRLLSRLAMLTGGADDYGEATELIELALIAAGDDLEARVEALVTGAFLDLNQGRFQQADGRADDALEIFRQLGDPVGVARVLDIRSITALMAGRFVPFVELADQVARLYRDCGKLLLVGFKQATAGWARAVGGDARQGLIECQEALELETLLGQREGVAVALFTRSQVLSALGRVEEARRNAEESLVICQEMGHRGNTALALVAIGMAQEAAGELQQAEETLRESVEISRGMPYQMGMAAAYLASVLAARGDLDGAESAARLSLDLPVSGGSLEARLVLTEVALARGAPGARALAVEALAFAEEHGWRWRPARDRLRRRVEAEAVEESAFEAQRVRRTFMFTDIVGSTGLVEVLGDEAWGHLLRWHDQTLRSLFLHHQGVEVKQVGDGFFVAFERAGDGVECAIAIQWALERHRRDHGFAPSVRIGLHEAEASREGADYMGRGVHEAARIGALAEGGEIVAGPAVAAQAGGQPVSEPRTATLKGISEPVEIVSIDWR